MELEKLEQAIRHDIVLHEQLRELVQNEKILFSNDNFDGIADEIIRRKNIEKEIETANNTISVLFGQMEQNDACINDPSGKVISKLLDNLRSSITRTMYVVEQTGNELRKLRKETLSELKTFDKRRYALKSYTTQ